MNLRLPRIDPLYACICAGLLLIPVSNAVGQIPVYLASLGWVALALRGRSAPPRWSTLVFLALYAALICVGLLYAVRPAMGISKLNRLLFFPFAGAVAATAGSDRRRWEGIALAVVGGVALRGVYDLIRFPAMIFGVRGLMMLLAKGDWAGIGEHLRLAREEFLPRLFDAGNMTSPQFYMVGLCVLLGLRLGAPERLGKRFWGLLILMTAGLLLHNKRGVWLATVTAIGAWTLLARQWRTLAMLLLAGALALCLPMVRTRLGQIRETLTEKHGSRITLWKQVAPRMFARYPWGMGYNGSTHEEFREVLPRSFHLERGLRHLHNNFLQIRLEMGWHGLAFWVLWMGHTLWRGLRPPREGFIPPGMALGAGIALLSLLLNGLVEYNFGDSEILMGYLTLFGLIDAANRPAPRQGAA